MRKPGCFSWPSQVNELQAFMSQVTAVLLDYLFSSHPTSQSLPGSMTLVYLVYYFPMFLWGCGVFVVVFVWWCFCGGVFCGGVFVMVFLWWCFCGGAFD